MYDRLPDDVYVDANGVPTERFWIDGQEYVVHHDDVPDKDLTVVRGIPCTTALRTVIDLAPDCAPADLEAMVTDCLERRMFTVEEALARVAEPDMCSRAGAVMLRELLRSPRGR